MGLFSYLRRRRARRAILGFVHWVGDMAIHRKQPSEREYSVRTDAIIRSGTPSEVVDCLETIQSEIASGQIRLASPIRPETVQELLDNLKARAFVS